MQCRSMLGPADRVMGVTDGGTDTASAAPKEALSYEQARDKLAAVVKRLETGGLTLEQSLELWERGERRTRCTGRCWWREQRACAQFVDAQPGRVDCREITAGADSRLAVPDELARTDLPDCRQQPVPHPTRVIGITIKLVVQGQVFHDRA